MSFIKVIAGELKGKRIPFAVNKFNNADITPQKIKGAVFSKIGEYLHGKSFLDLFACSGQMAVEAISRGAQPVIINEADNKRFRFISSFIEEIKKTDDVLLFNYPAKRLLAWMQKNNHRADYIFVDPPYEKQTENPVIYTQVLLEIEKRQVLAKNGCIIIQHFSINKLDQAVGSFSLLDSRQYANTTLAFFGKQ